VEPLNVSDPSSEIASFSPPEVFPEVKGYTVQRKLDEGGMGEVFLAHRENDRDAFVAIKLFAESRYRGLLSKMFPNLPPPLLNAQCASAAMRFKAEGFAGSQIRHPTFVSYMDHGKTSTGDLFLVMEFVPGERLDVYFDNAHGLGLTGRADGPDGARPVSQDSVRFARYNALKEAARVAHLIADALRAVTEPSEHGEAPPLVAHRDIKPSNILVVADPRGVKKARPKILDLGIAKVSLHALHGLGVSVTMMPTQGAIGTYGFMAPEALAGKITPAVDLQSSSEAMLLRIFRHFGKTS
jgi:serine/threonine-protein kinase